MDVSAALLLSQLKTEQQRVSERMHRDSRRQNLLKRASVMLGTGMSAESVKDWLAAAHIVLPVTRKMTEAYDQYGRTAAGR